MSLQGGRGTLYPSTDSDSVEFNYDRLTVIQDVDKGVDASNGK